MNELFRLVEQWAHDRNIINGCTSKDQFLKLDSEFGELALHIYERNALNPMYDDDFEEKLLDIHSKMRDDIGDCLVVATIVAAQEGFFIGDLLGLDTTELAGVQNGAFLKAQASKGKLGDAILKRQPIDISVYLSQFVDYLAAYAADNDFNIVVCLQEAYMDIKDRKGVMYNGTFIKESDPAYAGAKFQVDAQNNSSAASGV